MASPERNLNSSNMKGSTFPLQTYLDLGVPASLAESINWFKPRHLARGPKSFIICCDGTANQIFPDEGRNSNVSRLARCVSAGESPSGKPQIVAYQGGLGVDIIPLAYENLSAVIGTGLDLNICLAYEWLCEVYEAKSDIVLSGFSRGAYTAKILAVFICDNGLLIPLKDKNAFRRVIANTYQAWCRNRRRRASVVAPPQNETSVAFRPDITALALWEPVRTLGISMSPGDSTDMINERMDFAQFELPDKVEHVFQVLATHERRDAYAPSLFRRRSRDRQVLRQIWFPGTHTAVGGGSTQNMDRYISVQSLAWMLSCFEEHKIIAVDRRRFRQLVESATPSTLEKPHPMHDSYLAFYKSAPRTPGRYFQSVDYRETGESSRWQNAFNRTLVVPRTVRNIVTESPSLPEEPLQKLEKEVERWVDMKISGKDQTVKSLEVAYFEGIIIDGALDILLLDGSRSVTTDSKPRRSSSTPEFKVARKPSRIDKGQLSASKVSESSRRKPKMRAASIITENKKIENIEIRNIRETFVDSVRINDQVQNTEEFNHSQSNWTQDNVAQYSTRSENESWQNYQNTQDDQDQYAEAGSEFFHVSFDQYHEHDSAEQQEVSPDWEPGQDYTTQETNLAGDFQGVD